MTVVITLKYVLEAILAFCIRLFHLLPLHRDRVFFSAFSGRQYSDSPRRISEYLRNERPDIRQVWAFNEPEKFAFLKEHGIKVVKYKSLSHLYYALCSKVYVDNVEYWSLLRFRKTQMVVETWHGGGAYKRIGGDRIDVGVGCEHSKERVALPDAVSGGHGHLRHPAGGGVTHIAEPIGRISRQFDP